jgi:hypothetical protein
MEKVLETLFASLNFVLFRSSEAMESSGRGGNKRPIPTPTPPAAGAPPPARPRMRDQAIGRAPRMPRHLCLGKLLLFHRRRHPPRQHPPQRRCADLLRRSLPRAASYRTRIRWFCPSYALSLPLQSKIDLAPLRLLGGLRCQTETSSQSSRVPRVLASGSAQHRPGEKTCENLRHQPMTEGRELKVAKSFAERYLQISR